MGFSFTNKKVWGVVIVLLLIVLLSQAKTFNFLIDTSLGRLALILIILVASYIHNILGGPIVLSFVNSIIS